MKTSNKEQLTPFLTDKMIEDQALQDLRSYQKLTGKPLSYPLFPEEMVEKLWDISIDFLDDVKDKGGQKILACFLPEEKKIAVNLSMKGTDGRMSFTLAHEAGHVSLHKFLSNIGVVEELCRGGVSEEEEAQMIERQADKYAGYLLMPTEIVKEKLAEMGYSMTTTVDLGISGKILREYFGVSSHALEMRLSSMGVGTVGGYYKMMPKKIGESVFEEMDKKRERWVS